MMKPTNYAGGATMVFTEAAGCCCDTIPYLAMQVVLCTTIMGLAHD